MHDVRVNDSTFVCPACGFPALSVPPYNNWPGLPLPTGAVPPYQDYFGSPSFEICPSCGYEFGFDDHPGASGSVTSFVEHRHRWVAGGCAWWGREDQRPVDWSGLDQLAAAGLGTDP
jgi:hypothetical protein